MALICTEAANEILKAMGWVWIYYLGTDSYHPSAARNEGINITDTTEATKVEARKEKAQQTQEGFVSNRKDSRHSDSWKSEVCDMIRDMRCLLC
jgi:hypothetical protein